MSSVSFFYITVPNEKIAETLAETLIHEKLIACANILPQMKSIYVWENKLHKENESVLLLKTDARLKGQLTSRLKQLHPYQVPCLAEIKLDSLNPEYSQWLLSSIL